MKRSIMVFLIISGIAFVNTSSDVVKGGSIVYTSPLNCEHDIKWSQPPEEIQEGIINGWDEVSDYNRPPMPIVADDWLCVDNRPIKDIHWWGSFKGWTEPNRVPPAQMPEAFHIGIWTNVPDPEPDDPNTFSHPGELIWEKTSHSFVWSFAGNDLDPRSHELVPIIDTFTTIMEGINGDPFVTYDAGLYKMWYGATGQSIAYAESNNGIVWFNNQVVHDCSFYYYYRTGSPWVLKEGETYRMWHFDYYEWIAGDWSHYIAHMTSNDGINWPAFMSAEDQKVLSALGQPNPQGDGFCVFAPCVLYEPGIGYTMWYSVFDHYGPAKIWRATSTDGITWTNRQLSLPYVPNTWENDVRCASVVKESDGTYTMFYIAWEANFTQAAIGIAKSFDGITWTERKQFLRGSDLGANITLFRAGSTGLVHFTDVDGKRYLYFTYYDKGDGKYKFGRIQIAAVTDACFKFDQLLSENEWFHQEANEPNGTVYWLSIAAIYDPCAPEPNYPWGWKTRPHYYKDGAVRIQTLVGGQWPPRVGSGWESGVPIRLPEYPDPCGVSWDMAFVLTTDREYVPLKWRWADDAYCADLFEDGKIDFKDFAILAEHWLNEAEPWP